jgi:ribosomal protein S21
LGAKWRKLCDQPNGLRDVTKAEFFDKTVEHQARQHANARQRRANLSGKGNMKNPHFLLFLTLLNFFLS